MYTFRNGLYIGVRVLVLGLTIVALNACREEQYRAPRKMPTCETCPPDVDPNKDSSQPADDAMVAP